MARRTIDVEISSRNRDDCPEQQVWAVGIGFHRDYDPELLTLDELIELRSKIEIELARYFAAGLENIGHRLKAVENRTDDLIEVTNRKL